MSQRNSVNAMIDFYEPQRMSLNAFFIIFVKILKSIFGLSVVYIFVKIFGSDIDFSESGTWVRIGYSVVAVILVALLLAGASYYPKKFYVKEGNLVFIHGLLSRESTTIPLDRIHSLRTRQGIWYRLFEMRGIVFDTLAAKGEEIELILDEKDWISLRNVIESEERNTKDLESETKLEVKRFANKYLLSDALCQNHLKGMAILGGFLAVVFDGINNFTDNAVETISCLANSFSEAPLLSPLGIVCFFSLVYVVILSLWIGKVFLRYSDMSLKYDKLFLSFSYGLLSRSSSRFAYGKVCTLWIKRNFLERKFGLCTLMLKQALNVSAQKDDDNLKLYGFDSSDFFLKWWLGDDYRENQEILCAKSGRGVFVHSISFDFFVSVVVAIILINCELYIWLIATVLYLAISVLKGIYAMRRSRIILKESYLVVFNGRFAEIENYVKYQNIESVRIRKTPFSRFSRRMTLIFSTAGTTFFVRSLLEEDASQIYNHLLLKTLNLPVVRAN